MPRDSSRPIGAPGPSGVSWLTLRRQERLPWMDVARPTPRHRGQLRPKHLVAISPARALVSQAT